MCFVSMNRGFICSCVSCSIWFSEKSDVFGGVQLIRIHVAILYDKTFTICSQQDQWIAQYVIRD